jgi:hypothetical protein
MAFKVRVRRANGETVMSDVVRAPTPIFGSTLPVLIGDQQIVVQVVALTQRLSESGELIDYLEGNEV